MVFYFPLDEIRVRGALAKWAPPVRTGIARVRRARLGAAMLIN